MSDQEKITALEEEIKEYKARIIAIDEKISKIEANDKYKIDEEPWLGLVTQENQKIHDCEIAIHDLREQLKQASSNTAGKDIDKQIELERLKLERMQCELKMSPKVSGCNSVSGSKPPSGSSTPGGGKVKNLRNSISASNYVSTVSSLPDRAPDPDAVVYHRKLKSMLTKIDSNLSVSNTGGKLAFSIGLQSVGSVRVPKGENEADKFYKKLYYFFCYECEGNPETLCKQVNTDSFEEYNMNKDTPPRSSS